MPGYLPAEPSIAWSDLSIFGESRWESIDAMASAWLGQPCLALPSVRVGICWALEHAGLRRHADHVLVPRFVGRCILNSLNRFALPVEQPTASTRMAIVVDQYGLRQPLVELSAEFARRGWAYLEDSPYGVGDDETPGPGSVGRFIGLGKVLPAAQGALVVTRSVDLDAFIRHKRAQQSGWSAAVWLTVVALRARRRVGSYSTIADAAYELYPAGRGGHRWLRGNIARAIRQASAFGQVTRERLDRTLTALGDRALSPDLRRLGYVVPCFPGEDLSRAQDVLRRFGLDGSSYHVDLARNMLQPEYVKAVLLPLNPRIPREVFDGVLNDLRPL